MHKGSCHCGAVQLAEVLFNQARNPSIERASSGGLRSPAGAAQVERQVLW